MNDDQKSTNPLYHILIEEAIAMAKYALSSGKQLSAANAVVIAQAAEAAGIKMQALADETGAADTLPEIATEQADAPAATMPDLRKLVQAHNQLSQLVAPATPRTIVLLESAPHGRRGWGTALGPVPLVRQLMIVSLSFLILFLGTSLSPSINSQTITQSFSDLQGLELLVNELFLLSAAGLGASFAALVRANRYITRGTYDPKYTPSYWIQVALGIIAGIILAELVSINPGDANTLHPLAKPTLALLGGFSASAVYTILKQLLAALESLFKGDMQDTIDAQRSLAQAGAQQKIQEERFRTAAKLVELKDQIESGTDSDAVKQSLNQVLNELISAELPTAVAQDGTAAGSH